MLTIVEKRYRREEECEVLFRRMGTVFNANTPENHPVVFSSDEQFKAGMSILALCARMFDDVRIYAFQLMSNHIHLVVGGDRLRIQEFFAYFVGRLDKYFEGRSHTLGEAVRISSSLWPDDMRPWQARR